MGRWRQWWLFSLIFGGVGLLFLGVGGVLLWVLPQGLAERTARVEELPIAGAGRLQELGITVLLEATISPQMAPSDVPPLVAYRGYQRVRRGEEWRWEMFREYAPPLWVEKEGQRIGVRAGYQLGTLSTQVTEGRDRDYRGLTWSEPVVVLGTVVTTGEVPILAGTEVSQGTRESYLADLHQSQRVVQGLGWILVGVGGAAVAISVGGAGIGGLGSQALSRKF